MNLQKFGRFQVLGEIGAGGMGVVYRAHDNRLERDVAVKVMPPGFLTDTKARKRFHKEALALSRLNHPNVETVHDFDTEDGTEFLVTELIRGSSLASKLADGPLSIPQVIRYGLQIAKGLSAAHEQGVIHCDLKSSNLVVSGDGHLKIIDFGLARLSHPEAHSALTASLESMVPSGTLPYMAPEQLRGKVPDVRSDIYSLGAVLYEMATARLPFAHTHGPLLIDAILNHAPEPPSHVNSKVTPGLQNIILKALDKDPARRYQSAREVEVDLERLTLPSYI